MNSINHEGKVSHKHFVCNDSECDNCSHTTEEFDEGIVNYEAEHVVAPEDIEDLRKIIKKKAEENCQERKAAQLLEESMSIQLNDKEKVCHTQKAEIDSLKEEIEILSMFQTLVAKYEGSLEQNKKELSKLRIENHSLKDQVQKYHEECQDLMRQIESNFEEDLRRQLNMKVEICQRQEREFFL